MCLLWLELMCWPLTRRGGHTATTKETERPPHPGGSAGAMRRSDRGRRRGCSRRAGMIDAARRWKARAATGCAQAPDLKPQARPRSSLEQFGLMSLPSLRRRRSVVHSSGVKQSSRLPISFQRTSTVHVAALRSSALSVANRFSMGFRSGEYGGRYRRWAPTASRAALTPTTV